MTARNLRKVSGEPYFYAAAQEQSPNFFVTKHLTMLADQPINTSAQMLAQVAIVQGLLS